MAKTTTTKPETSDPVSAGMAAAMAAFSPVATTAWFDIMQENMRFLTERLQTDMETQRAMLACKTPQELMALQADFYKKAFAQYTEETQRLMKMMGTAMTAAADDAETGHKRGYDDVPV